jgi:hypothetical protein
VTLRALQVGSLDYLIYRKVYIGWANWTYVHQDQTPRQANCISSPTTRGSFSPSSLGLDSRHPPRPVSSPTPALQTSRSGLVEAYHRQTARIPKTGSYRTGGDEIESTLVTGTME